MTRSLDKFNQMSYSYPRIAQLPVIRVYTGIAYYPRVRNPVPETGRACERFSALSSRPGNGDGSPERVFLWRNLCQCEETEVMQLQRSDQIIQEPETTIEELQRQIEELRA